MSIFSDLQARHEQLVNDAQSSEEILEQVQQYLKDIQSGSSQVSSARERDQLRANLRYWASYVYEKTKEYPNVDLLPSTVLFQTNRKVLFSILLVFLLLCAIGYFGSVVLSGQITPPVTATSTPPPTKNAPTAITPTVSLQAPTPTYTPVAGETLAVSDITSVQITSVKNNDQVQPITSISGTYSNLAPGSSIHLIIQPLSRNGLRFPVKQYALISANSTSGEWAIEAKFGQGSELEKQEDYVLSIAVAPDLDTRNKLIDAVDTGFQEYPSGVFQFAQKVVVSRAAYATAIDGVQVIYSSYLDIEGNMEIFAMNPDGSEPHRITYTSGLNEMFPSLSPDGKQIVYVGQRRDKDNKGIYSIETINSDGTTPVEIVAKSRLVYEHPLWSYDGKYIAYAVGTSQADGAVHWNIHAYDVEKRESFQITEGEQITKRYFSWIPGTLDIVFAATVEQTQTIGFLRINIFSPKEEKIFFDDKVDEFQPALSPDGTHLAYMQLDRDEDAVLASGAGNIYMVNLADGKPFQLTKGLYQDENPVWAADNKTIFFESFEVGFRSIWSINIDGTNLKQLTTGKDQYPFVGYMYAIIP